MQVFLLAGPSKPFQAILLGRPGVGGFVALAFELRSARPPMHHAFGDTLGNRREPPGRGHVAFWKLPTQALKGVLNTTKYQQTSNETNKQLQCLNTQVSLAGLRDS